MKRPAVFIIALGLINALSHLAQAEEAPAQAPAQNQTSKIPYYMSAVYGSGTGSEGGSMKAKSFEIRVGTPTGIKNFRVDLVHLNEGHPDNNHRDGFAVQPVYRMSVTDDLKAEAGVGPYYSMNTTTKNGQELDDKKWGVVATFAALYYVNSISPGLHVRAEYNHVEMPGAISTDAYMVGVGKDFDSESHNIRSEKPNYEIAVIANDLKTNHTKTTSAYGYQVEIRNNLGKRTAVTVGYMGEGKDELVDRNGVYSQLWYVVPVTETVSLSLGAGAYVAKNQVGDHPTTVNGLVSLQAEKKIGKSKKTSIFFRFSRIADPQGNDRDAFGVGVSRSFE